MVRYVSSGPERLTGGRLHMEIAEAGEKLWVELTGGDRIGHKRFASWRGTPPVDVVDHGRGIAYQSKVISRPRATHLTFSGAHKEVVARLPTGGNIYFGEPEDKLVRIRDWLKDRGWEGWKIVMLYNETPGTVVVYSRRGVSNAGIAEMEPVATFDNATGVWRRIPGTPDEVYPPGVPDEARLATRFPEIPEHLRSDIDDIQAKQLLTTGGIFRRAVRVSRHTRRTR